jgi:hypothetical protein
METINLTEGVISLEPLSVKGLIENKKKSTLLENINNLSGKNYYDYNCDIFEFRPEYLLKSDFTRVRVINNTIYHETYRKNEFWVKNMTSGNWVKDVKAYLINNYSQSFYTEYINIQRKKKIESLFN